MSSTAVRHLTVLGEFKPFGLIAEALDGKPADDVPDKYDYFLFDPDTVRDRDETDDHDVLSSAFSDRCDHELFIRGNRIIWSTGPRVCKRFTLPSPVIKACWCRLGDMTKACLCVLQTACLTICNTSGEVVSIPVSEAITSIWPLPFGLLLQQAAQPSSTTYVPSLSSSPLFGESPSMSSVRRGVLHNRKEAGVSPQHNFSFASGIDHAVKEETSSMSSHLILQDPLEELQLAYIEERGKLNIMKEFDENTIWTSDRVPLMASYNTGKMQHSVWVAETNNLNLDLASANLVDAVPNGIIAKHCSFRRIWQGKGAKTAASKVFLATDDDAAPIICFLHQEQKKLLSLRLQSVEINNELLFDIKPDMSWSIPAVAAVPVIVTRPRATVGLLPYSDMLILAPENAILLYSGKQCLCRYMLPSSLSKDRFSHSMEFPETSVSQGLKIVGLTDAVEGRINVTVNNGQIYRCVLRRSPTSSLANDCITAMAEGLSSSFYSHFLSLLWKDGDSAYLSEADSSVHSEWDSFRSIIMEMCQSTATSKMVSNPVPQSSWEFLISSKFHDNFCKNNFIAQNSSVMSLDVRRLDASQLSTNSNQRIEKTFHSELLMESLHCLHAVYESLKLNNLRKRDLELLGSLLCYIAKFLGEEGYVDHYIRDFPGLSRSVGICEISFSKKSPPSLFRWLENCLLYGHDSANTNDLPPLICEEGKSVVNWARKIALFYSLLTGAKQIGKKLSSGIYCNIATGSYCTNEELTVLAMVGEKFGLQQLDSLPSGMSLPLRHALAKCRESPPTGWPAAAYVLLGREDLALSCLAQTCNSKDLETETNVNFISMSAPYMLHLHPVTIPSAVSDTNGLDNTKFEDTDSIDGSTTDGMEHIFNSSTQLRYGRDLRLNEVRRLLCSARPVAIQTSVNPSASDQDLQQAFVVPKIVLAGRLPAQQNATVNLDPNVRNVEEIKTWPEFHNAVAAGLRLAPLQGKMSKTWIKYNKPEEPNAIHAGLLFALGLHGYLRVLNITDIFQYFRQEHDITSLGLMLGLAATYRGTMQPEISKCLFVHIPARYPSSFPELELPTLLQSAALMSVGLLYEGSAHAQTMQILLGEIGRRTAGDNVLEREGYAVSAGFSLGLLALGRGEDALGFMETLVDKLFHYIGGKEGRNCHLILTSDSTFHLQQDRSISSTLSVDDNRAAAQMMEGTAVNVDVTAPGATIALALMFLRAYVNIVAGACISLGLRFAGTKDGHAQELLYNYAVYFLNEIKPVSATSGNLPKGLSRYVDRGTLEICLHLIVLSLCVVMAGSGHLQTFKLLRFLRSRNSADGQVNYGVQMAVSLAIGFLFLGGGMQTFSTSNSSVAALLITLYPRLPTGPNDNRCHFQAFRHFYVLATEARWIQTVDVDTGLPVYAPLEVTVRETEHYAETSFCEVTPCLLPERAILKTLRICGPRYWPQVIDLVPEDKPWWTSGDKSSPFNSGVLYIKRKVGACSYIDDPVGCQSLLSRAMHKVFGLTTLKGPSPSSSGQNGPGSVTVDQLVGTFSSDPSLIAFAQLCCDPSWKSRSDIDFQEFCLQVLFECVSKDRPALLQVYLSLYTTMGSMAGQVTSDTVVLCDSLSVSNLKLALAYNEALLSGRLTSSRGGIVQSNFIACLRKQVEALLDCSQDLKDDFCNYMYSGKWPNVEESQGNKRSILLSWYLQWFCVPSPSAVKTAVDKVMPKLKSSSSLVPFLRLLFPKAHVNAITEIDKYLETSTITQILSSMTAL
ncbi:PREDICTED: anaphase-promoting complex subunit 1-like [Fragaria vesca subsp. vesca]